MLSPKTNARILLSLVLIFIFTTSSDELRIATGTILSGDLGHKILCRFPLPAHIQQTFYAYFLLSLVALAATNDLFYEQTCGRFWDMYFERCDCDPDVPGSGFADWRDAFVVLLLVSLGASVVAVTLGVVVSRRSLLSRWDFFFWVVGWIRCGSPGGWDFGCMYHKILPLDHLRIWPAQDLVSNGFLLLFHNPRWPAQCNGFDEPLSRP